MCRDFEVGRLQQLTRAAAEARAAAERTRMLLPAAITVVYAMVVCALFAAGCWAISRGQLTGEARRALLPSTARVYHC